MVRGINLGSKICTFNAMTKSATAHTDNNITTDADGLNVIRVGFSLRIQGEGWPDKLFG